MLLHKCWFIAARGADKRPSEPVEVDADKFALLPAILAA